ncbi:NAD+ synthase [Magnetospirillum gryphiswaldense]|uniref:Glutamine-dependent NAD(+) synthetase n=1 Tax=Magnetospirillum gryphiswaldense TaxID=55518 RepID=A4U4V2_9PROT|nr:NAD+ synthase [Magnetospirillum gryphiswaldense]AVM72730.1 Glutamine-dependent NAD(+) synthetase [Magnetospirillum gryphiswaldense MSR-1]AVM76633.1 Glutamine-dependent NAD(+) synthetase [Magnetospirillum gryphiswaldense]CAM77909.1 NH3-dependent NAD+ synthetase protein [Magnetospirillum gryphiswaldense MSR-1]
MSDSLSIAFAQINPVVGDVAGNVARIRAARAQAAADGAQLVVFPELVVSGYPPEDLVLKSAFLDAIEQAVEDLAADTADNGPAILVGAPWRVAGRLHNAALLLDHGRVAASRLKHHLPNYGVFDEARVFAPGPVPGPIQFRGVRLGVLVCEDMWYSDVAETLAECGAEILVVPNGSPFELDKVGVRLSRAKERVAETGLPLIYVNQLGGQDELVFDGASFALDAKGEVMVRLPAWAEQVVTTRWHKQDGAWSVAGPIAPIPERDEDLYQAMVLGLRDYVGKNGFPGVVLGLSGGIDSALAAAVAADALGADKVWCVMMPSPYTSQESLDDAAGVAKMLGCRLDNINIGPAMGAFDHMLAPHFAGTNADITEENLQSRARGVTLMALSNKFGPMVLSTGNKSEMSTGYATLYGDMCGGYAVLKDVYKTAVFAVCRWRNGNFPAGALGPNGPVMPERVITKPPSAELKPDQTDQDTLPPYDVLDGILSCLIEGELSVEATVAKGYDDAMVRRIWRMLDRAEYKRRQAPPGVKITGRSFGKDRRYPITNGFTRSV